MRMLPIFLALAVVAVLPGSATTAQPAGGVVHSTEDVSYGVGFFLGDETRTGLARDGMGVDLDLIAMGFRDGFDGADPIVPRGQMQQVLTAVNEEMERRTMQRLLAESPEFQRMAHENDLRSRRFHELFGKQEGVVTLPSGVQYKVLRPGTGRTPRPTSAVVVKARIETTHRTVIHDGERPQTVRVDQVSKGGAELLQLMSEGARWQVAVPPKMAHGELGRYPDIGPNETLVGTVELIEVQ